MLGASWAKNIDVDTGVCFLSLLPKSLWVEEKFGINTCSCQSEVRLG